MSPAPLGIVAGHMTERLAPIVLEYPLACTADIAFATYVDRIGEWWDPRYTANGETLEAVTIESGLGGRVYATHSDIGDHLWGEVTIWDPPHRLVHSFALAQDPDHPSRVEVVLVPGEPGCRLRFAHTGWTEANAASRSKFGDWSVMLDRLVALIDSAA